MAWRVARSLETLLAEINAAAPNRSTISDGSIGDPAHSSRESDHNPNPAGVVRARDFTHDPADGCDAGEIAERVRDLGAGVHPALGPGAYVIWNRRIASATFGWVWRAYTGSNPHDHHCHVSVQTDSPGYDSTAPWGVMEEPDMPLTADEIKRIANATWNETVLIDGGQVRTGRLLVRIANQTEIADDLARIAAQLSDDATKEQVRKARADINALRDQLETPNTEENR